MTKNENKKIKIQLIRSPNGHKDDQIATVRALGLKKLNQIKEVEDTPVIRGMVFKVKHFLKFL